MALHPLPVDLALGDLLTAFKNLKTNPGEAAHAGWHGVGYGLQLFHKNHEGFKASAATSKKVATKLAQVEKGLEKLQPKFAAAEAGDVSAIDWDTFKPWMKKLLELLIMLMG